VPTRATKCVRRGKPKDHGNFETDDPGRREKKLEKRTKFGGDVTGDTTGLVETDFFSEIS